MSLAIPTIHLNGTSAKSLLEDIENAHVKIGEAVQALAQSAARPSVGEVQRRSRIP